MIEEWATYEGDDFLESVEPSLRNILCRMKDAGDFDKVTILKPYSFVLVDEEKETIAELLLVDDDTILVNDELLKGLDKEGGELLFNHLSLRAGKKATIITTNLAFNRWNDSFSAKDRKDNTS